MTAAAPQFQQRTSPAVRDHAMTNRKHHNSVSEGQPDVSVDDWSDGARNGLPDVGQALHSVPDVDADTTGPDGEALSWDKPGAGQIAVEEHSTSGAQKSNRDLPRGG